MISIINKRKNRQGIELPRGRNKSSGKWLYRLAAVFFLATMAYALFFADFLNVTEVKIAGLDKLKEASIRSLVDDNLSGKYFGLVKKNNLILFSKNSLKKELMENFNRIEDVAIEKKFPNEIAVTIKERQLTMLICSAGECFVLNERGGAYPAKNFSQEELDKENLITLNDVTGAQISTENNPLEDDFRQFILDLSGRVLEETGIVLKKQYETPSRVSDDLKVETADGWKIYFSASVGMEKELSMLKTVLDNKIGKEKQQNLEYINLLINNKVFYKFKDGVEQTQETASVPASEIKKDEKKKKD